MTEEEFVATIEARHQGRLMRKKLRVLHHMARASIGIVAGARSVSSKISFLVEKLELIRRHICIIERTLVRLVDETEEGKYLLSIRGNYIVVAGLLAELGCFKAYRSAKQMIKMAGSNPSESESAGKGGTHTLMSKQERPAHANRLNGREIVGVALNRLLRLAFALVKNQTYYHVSKPELTLVSV